MAVAVPAAMGQQRGQHVPDWESCPGTAGTPSQPALGTRHQPGTAPARGAAAAQQLLNPSHWLQAMIKSLNRKKQREKQLQPLSRCCLQRNQPCKGSESPRAGVTKPGAALASSLARMGTRGPAQAAHAPPGLGDRLLGELWHQTDAGLQSRLGCGLEREELPVVPGATPRASHPGTASAGPAPLQDGGQMLVCGRARYQPLGAPYALAALCSLPAPGTGGQGRGGGQGGGQAGGDGPGRRAREEGRWAENLAHCRIPAIFAKKQERDGAWDEFWVLGQAQRPQPDPSAQGLGVGKGLAHLWL